MITIANSDQMLLNRFQLCANNIHSEFYQKHRFYILSELPNSFRKRVVFFPEIKEYAAEFVKFSDYVKEEIELIPIEIRQKVIEGLRSIELKYARKFSIFERKVTKFVNNLELFTKQSDLLDFSQLDIIIQPQIAGTIGSYSLFFTDTAIHLFPRFDATLTDMTTLFLHACMHRKYYFQYSVNSPKMLDDISHKVAAIKESPLIKSILPKIHPTHSLLKQNFCARLVEESISYLAELGMPLKSELLDITKIEGLTAEEHNFLKLLLENRRQMVSKSQIAKALWQENSADKYSEFALSKLIERVRRKLSDAGLSSHLIHTQRGSGIVLYD